MYIVVSFIVAVVGCTSSVDSVYTWALILKFQANVFVE